MAYSAPPTQATNDVIGATAWNRLVNNDIWFAGGSSASGKPMCLATRSTGFLVLDVTTTPVAFNTNVLDNTGIHSTTVNPSRFTAPVTGWYLVASNLRWTPHGTGVRIASLVCAGTVNGSETRVSAGGIFNTEMTPVAMLPMTAGNYIEASVLANAGTFLNILAGSWFWMEWISP